MIWYLLHFHIHIEDWLDFFSSSLLLWNLIIKEKEKVMFVMFDKVQKFFLSNRNNRNESIFHFSLISLFQSCTTTHKQKRVETSSKALMTIRESFKLCWFLFFFFLLLLHVSLIELHYSFRFLHKHHSLVLLRLPPSLLKYIIALSFIRWNSKGIFYFRVYWHIERIRNGKEKKRKNLCKLLYSLANDPLPCSI